MILMEVAESTPNPVYDGRKRQGCESVKTFEKGMRFTLYGTGQLTVDLFSMAINGGGVCNDPTLIVALLAASKPAKAEAFAEIIATSAGRLGSDAVIDRLMQDGILTEPQVRATVTAMLAEQEAAAQAEQAPAKPTPTPTPPTAPARTGGNASDKAASPNGKGSQEKGSGSAATSTTAG